MHARAAAKFVHLAARFSAHVRVARDEREMDGKSIMGILLLAAARGTTIRISADGADEQGAVAALADLVESGFGEDVCSA
jgi:phosphocarrier protein